MRLRVSLLLAWVVLCLGAVALRAGDTEYNVDMVTGASAEIRLTVPGGRAPQGGFLPVRVRIANRGTRERTWRLELRSGLNMMMMGMGGGGQLRSEHSFTVLAATTSEFFIFVPVPGGSGGRGAGSAVQGQIEGPEVEKGGFTLPLGFGWNAVTGPIAIEPALEAALQKILTAPLSASAAPPPTRSGRVRSMPSPPSATNAMERVSVIDPSVWPADWRMWSSFPTVMLEEQSWERLDASHRRALQDWVAMGGRLLLSPAQAGGLRRAAHGAGEVITLRTPLAWLEQGELSEVGITARGGPAPQPVFLVAPDFWSLSRADWELRGKHAWLTGFIFVFGVLIGPVNLFFFAPAGRRHRLFFTVPLISVAASVTLFAIITVSDGFGGEGTRRVLVVLLPEQNEVAVFQKQISRTGLLGGREFALPADVQLDRQADGDNLLGSGLQLSRAGDTASGDWFTSRTTQRHTLRRLASSRERLELVSAPGADPIVQSTVAATLHDFIYKDAREQIWVADVVAPGARVSLKKGDNRVLPGALVSHLMNVRWPAGAFYALGERTDTGVIATLPGIRWRDEKILFTGRLAAASTAKP